MSASQGWRIALLGATGAVGEEILHLLEERRFPVLELRAFASDSSEGRQVEFRGEEIPVESIRRDRLTDVDLVFCAAPGVLEALRRDLEEARTRIVDLSGTLELAPEIPLYLPHEGVVGELSGSVAVPRGPIAGLARALRALRAEVELERVTVVTLESASGAGRRGVGELSAQTLELLNSMTGEPGDPEVFAQPLAFDCLPGVGLPLEEGETSEEVRLAHVLRRLLASPALRIETTRVRVPIFGGSLACVHLALAGPLSVEQARELLAKTPGLDVLGPGELPTPRTRVGHDSLAVGRIRTVERDGPGLAFVLAMDDLRQGAALTALEAATRLLAS
ncbi:MAG: aspartate-semialdehyde dehydrogenase [Myxococcota bacterium]